jgi:hypothetical protein
VTYASVSELQDDYDTFLAHGGLLIPWEKGEIEANTAVMVRVDTPLDQWFDLVGRVVQSTPGESFMVAFDPEAEAARTELTRFLTSDPFNAAKEAESASEDEPADLKVVDRFQPQAGPPAARPKRKPKYLQLKLADPNALPEDSADEDSSASDAPDEGDGGFGEEATPVDDEPPSNVARKNAGAATSGGGASTDITFKTPDVGELYAVYIVKFPCLLDFADIAPEFLSSKLITLPFQREEEGVQSASSVRRTPGRRVGEPAKLRFQLPVKQTFEMWTMVAAVTPDSITFLAAETDPAFNNVCAYPATFNGRKRLGTESDSDRVGVEVHRFNEERNVEQEERTDIPIRLQLSRMSMEEKINLALSGGREARMALAQDPNKAIPHYLLRNARISLDEIAFMARLANMNPDILKKIAENPQYCQSPQVVRNLVFNPKTPLDVSVRLLDRLAKNDLIQLSKRTSMNGRLVIRAKKKLSGSKH